jgi:hypothetical protein
VALAALLGVFLLQPLATALDTLPMEVLLGDINRDGVIDILDVQGSINMALGASAAVPQADVDDSTTVDVRDVQTIINTALGVGGLVQPVECRVDRPGEGPFPVMAVAVSSDGRVARASIDTQTGYFRMNLDVGTSWSMGFMGAGGGALTSVRFPVTGYASVTLPLLQLASGNVLDLGSLPPVGEILAAADVRTLLSETAEPLDLGDYDGNGLPDILDELLFPLPVTIPFTSFQLPSELSELVLLADLIPCVDFNWAEPPAATLVGTETLGIPAFIEPILACIEESLRDWVGDDSIGIPSFFVDLYVDFAMDTLRAGMPEWLDGLDRIDLQDHNGNGIPDYLESALCVAGLFGPCHADGNRNTVADFLEDQNGNGIANLYDPAYATEDDIDGDGIPNHLDIDADGDGVPNYADAEPLNPNVS